MPFEPTKSVLVCNLTAIPQERRQAYQANTQWIFTNAQEVRELTTGYGWRLPNETEMLQAVAAFLSDERLCCPVFHFTLEIEPNQGPIWLSITGASDVREFIQAKDGLSLPVTPLWKVHCKVLPFEGK